MNDTWPRRSWISGAGTAIAALVLGSKPVAAQARGGFAPARHSQDEWLDTVPGKHRTFIDSSTVTGGGEAALYANNLYTANKSGYGLEERDVAVVVCLRHFSTVFAFTDMIWGKYGKALSDLVMFVDPKTHGVVAGAVKGNTDAIYQELVSNRIPNSHMVAAGVVAVNRAQEYGYTLLTAG